MFKTLRGLVPALAIFAAAGLAPQADAGGLTPYKKVSGVSGTVNSIGSDTMNNLMSLWCEGFARYYPNVRCQIEGKGSSTAPPALIESIAQIGPMSRPMKSTELDAFEKSFGYKPTSIRTSLDALAIYVNKDNPLRGLTIEQLDAIFSKTRKCGSLEDLQTWGQAGLTGRWAPRPISSYGRNAASGTYGYFKNRALCKGDYKDTVKEQPGSASVVQSITSDLYSIGYSGIGYKTSGVRAIPLAKAPGGPYLDATRENVLNGSYPLGRFLYIYINKAPNTGLDTLIGEFMRFILSAQGQAVVEKDGYSALPSGIVEEELVKIE